MQKIAIKEKILALKSILISNSILHVIEELRPPLDSKNFENFRRQLIQGIIDSKSNFDSFVRQDAEFKLIMDSILTNSYSTESISSLVSTISSLNHQSKDLLFHNKEFLDYFILHKSLLNTNSIIDAVISESKKLKNVIIFTLVSEEDPIISKIVEVLSTLQELIDLVEKIFVEEQDNKIYLLDKGSNTNIGVETGVKTAQSLFKFLKKYGIG